MSPKIAPYILLSSLLVQVLFASSTGYHRHRLNMTTNITSLVVFLHSGQVLTLLGLVGAACCMLGNYIGSGLVLTKGTKIVRPIILVVLVLL